MKYKKTYIPNGFIHLSGEWNTGFTIENVKDKSRFTWIPLGVIPNILTEFENAQEKFYMSDYNSIRETIENYEGFYFSSYPISKTDEGKTVSLPNQEYWTCVSLYNAKLETGQVSKVYFSRPSRMHLPYVWEYDAIIKCLKALNNTEEISDEMFENAGIYGINDLWIWTLTKYNEQSNIVKKGANPEKVVYASNDYTGYKNVGFRIILTD